MYLFYGILFVYWRADSLTYRRDRLFSLLTSISAIALLILKYCIVHFRDVQSMVLSLVHSQALWSLAMVSSTFNLYPLVCTLLFLLIDMILPT